MISLHRNETETKLEIQDITTDIMTFLKEPEADSDIVWLKTTFFMFMKTWEKWFKTGMETPGVLCNLQEIKSPLEAIVLEIEKFKEKSEISDSDHILKVMFEKYCILFQKLKTSLECVNVFLEKHPDHRETQWLKTLSFTKKNNSSSD